MRCDMATIERHLLALAGNWLHWGCTGCTASTVGLCQIKAFQAQQSIKVVALVVVAVLFLAFGCWLRRARQSAWANKLPSPSACVLSPFPSSSPALPPPLSLSPSLFLANLLKCRRLALPFHTFYLHLHIPLASLSPFFCLCSLLSSFFVA